MLTPKRRNLYIGIIAFCILATAVVFVMQTRTVAPEAPSSVAVTEAPALTDTQSGVPSPVAVYPRSSSFDTGFFESSTYKLLKSFQPLEVDPSELGVEDPFKPL